MKKLTARQMEAVVSAVDAGVFPDTDTEHLRIAVKKLREGIRYKRDAQQRKAHTPRKESE